MKQTSDTTPKKTPKEVNLRPQWKPGQSGNPKGRPKGSISLTEAIKRKLKELTPDKKRLLLDVLADRIVKGGIVDEKDSIQRLIWNYLDGMPRQGLDIKHEIKEILTDEQINRLLLRRTKKDIKSRQK